VYAKFRYDEKSGNYYTPLLFLLTGIIVASVVICFMKFAD